MEETTHLQDEQPETRKPRRVTVTPVNQKLVRWEIVGSHVDHQTYDSDSNSNGGRHYRYSMVDERICRCVRRGQTIVVKTSSLINKTCPIIARMMFSNLYWGIGERMDHSEGEPFCHITLFDDSKFQEHLMWFNKDKHLVSRDEPMKGGKYHEDPNRYISFGDTLRNEKRKAEEAIRAARESKMSTKKRIKKTNGSNEILTISTENHTSNEMCTNIPE